MNTFKLTRLIRKYPTIQFLLSGAAILLSTTSTLAMPNLLQAIPYRKLPFWLRGMLGYYKNHSTFSVSLRCSGNLSFTQKVTWQTTVSQFCSYYGSLYSARHSFLLPLAYWSYCTQLGMRFKTFTRTSFPIHHKELGHIITSHGRIPDSRRSKLSSTSPWLAPSLTFRGILGWSMFIYYICNY